MFTKKLNATRIFSVFGLTTLLATLNGCDNLKTANSSTPTVNCSDNAGISTVISTLADDSERSIKQERDDISLQTIRANLSTLNMNVQNIRTSKTDPGTTKIFCEAEIIISPPMNLIHDANTSLKNSNDVKVKDIGILLENMGWRPSKSSTNSYEKTISYSLQPTDDGKTIVSAIEDGGIQLVSGIKDLILWSMTNTSPKNTTAQTGVAQNVKAETSTVNVTRVQPTTTPVTHNSPPSYPPQKTHLHCSIGNTIASKPCLVSEEGAIANTPLTAKYFGQNGRYRQITIVWPDNDVSRYAVIDGQQLINLRKPNSGHYHLDYPRNGQIILNDGLNILRDGKPYISLW